jgi:hypothetical protein
VNGDGFDDELVHEEEESFGRPFLGKVIQAETGTNNARDDAEPETELPTGHSRPYLVTGGRTGGGAAGIGIETVLVRDRAAMSRYDWPMEMTLIVGACESPVAVAEVAARTGLPIGVVQVLAGDLVASGLLLRSASSSSMALADDVQFIERLIQGVTAL